MSDIIAQYRGTLAAAADRTALIEATRPGAAPRRVSYSELEAAAAGLAGKLAGRGLRPGDRLAVMLPNGLDFAVLYLACLHGSITVVPVNPGLPADDIAYILRLAAPRLILVDLANAEKLPRGVVPTWIVVTAGELLVAADASPAPCSARADDILSITFTSGTTSRPKGACHRTGPMLANVAAYNELIGFGRNSRLMHVMPMTYMAGFLNTLLGPIMAGGSVILAPQFDAATALRFWQPAIDQGATAMWLTPTMLAALVNLDRDSAVRAWTHQNLETICIGTAPLPGPLKADFEERFGVELLESYGMTELLLVSGNTSRFPRTPGSVGRLLPGIAVEVRGQHGTPLAITVEGELWVKSPYEFLGYLEPGTGEIVSPLEDGWFPTGDIGRQDADGNLFITGRRKDLIIRGGLNVSPRAVEEVLLADSAVAEAAVVGLPHPFWGEEVAAFLQLRDGADLAAAKAGLIARCRNRLPAEAVPDRLVVVREFPRSITGKIRKLRLREDFLAASSSGSGW